MLKIISLLFITSSLIFSQSPVPESAELELIADGFQFVEGPVWNDTLGLLFSDMPANRVYRWTEEDSISVFLDPSANSNGLTYDLDGNLILAQTGLRRVARKTNGSFTSLAETFDNKKLNSPNDLAVKSDGSIFFTDPPFNIPQGEQQELTFAGIYRISPFGELQLLDSTLNLPNGICFSPDETKLYVNNSQARIIYVWDVIDDSTISNKEEFARINPIGYADGMKVDPSGNLFCTGPLGVWVFSPDGNLLDTILVPISPTNCNWGDEDRKTLFITAGNSVYKIDLETATSNEDQGNLRDKFELYQNYPNPFNPKTTIKYEVGINQYASLKVYDTLGNRIATLFNEEKPAGKYEIDFDGSELSSGIYYYQFKAGGFTQTKKLVLMK
jgi:gluconolactonase